MTRYQIILRAKPSPRWMWIPPFTFVALLRFPYLAYDATNGEWPYGEVIGVANTKRHARRLVRRYRMRGSFQRRIVAEMKP